MVAPVRTRVGTSLLVALLSACGESVYVGSDIIWSAQHETGDLAEWTVGAAGAAGGTGMGEDEGTLSAVQDYAHSGRFAAKLTKTVDTSSIARGGGPRLVHTGVPEHAFYSAWYLVPAPYQTHSYWTIMQFDSPTMINAVFDRGVNLQLRSLPDGTLVLQTLFHAEAYLLAPLAYPIPQVPVGRWFHVEAEFHAAMNAKGKMVVWLDGKRVYDLQGRPTLDAKGLEFMVSNMLLDAEPSPVELYVDDVVISRTRITPGGRLSSTP
jgi:hypothetical protein